MMKQKSKASKPLVGFASDEDLFDLAGEMFSVRTQLHTERLSGKDPEKIERLQREDQAQTRRWHQQLALTKKGAFADKLIGKMRFKREEYELLALLCLNGLGLLGGAPGYPEPETVNAVLRMLALPRRESFSLLRSLSPGGKLFRAGLLSLNEDELIKPSERKVGVHLSLLDDIVNQGQSPQKYEIGTEKKFLEELYSFASAAQRVGSELSYVRMGGRGREDFYTERRRYQRRLETLSLVLEKHSDWKISQGLNAACDDIYTPTRKRLEYLGILLALVSRELGAMAADSALYQGSGLAALITKTPETYLFSLRHFQSDRELVSCGIIQPCGGQGCLIEDNPNALEDIEFELTDKVLETLNLKRMVRKNREGTYTPREAKVSFSNLVLPPKVEAALEMVLAQTGNQDRIFKKWGLAEKVAYGRGVTVLFSGPPGVGKTASAEALAKELNRPILVADYSQIQNCFVGQTEKNIKKVFREAAAHDAVLFWDEADAMFYDRDKASQNWEVRDVNVILQEIERFEGVCILATNRKVTLDKALERRIAIKVEFERPDEAMRLELWKRILPKKMPLGRNVNLRKLSEAELSGGEIKNVLLNAVRIALARERRMQKANGNLATKTKTCVEMADFEEAIHSEQNGQWNRRKSMGF